MAFIGFKTSEEAERALKYFDKSYLDTSRLVVEVRPGYSANRLLL
jgi:multiple RNA-binding domain-containing protein 1